MMKGQSDAPTRSRWDRGTIGLLGVAGALLLVSAVRWLGTRDLNPNDVLRATPDDTSAVAGPLEPWLRTRIDPSTAYQLGQVGRLLGSDEADVMIVVFANAACGHCAEFHWTLERILERYPDHVSVRYRHYVPTMDRPTLRMHLGAECAADQGKFAEYTAVTYRRPNLLGERRGWRDAADSVGVADMAEFVGCTEGRRYIQRVIDDNAAAERIGVGGTPTSFLNGVRIVGAAAFESIDSLVAFHLDRIR